jgi:hypothetical protein
LFCDEILHDVPDPIEDQPRVFLIVFPVVQLEAFSELSILRSNGCTDEDLARQIWEETLNLLLFLRIGYVRRGIPTQPERFLNKQRTVSMKYFVDSRMK